MRFQPSPPTRPLRYPTPSTSRLFVHDSPVSVLSFLASPSSSTTPFLYRLYLSSTPACEPTLPSHPVSVECKLARANAKLSRTNFLFSAPKKSPRTRWLLARFNCRVNLGRCSEPVTKNSRTFPIGQENASCVCHVCFLRSRARPA